tara:strand:+ start:4215 stop:4394 length:180 start_codon:yes stop_codon:yes gene_type:complete
LNPKLQEILVCPVCKGKLIHQKKNQELICKVDRVAFPIRNSIPVMLLDEARELAADEET